MSDRAEERGWHLPGGVAEARSALIAWVDDAGPAGRRFLEAHLVCTVSGHYQIRHHLDREIRATELDCRTDPVAAREIAQTTGSGEHRPLKTAPTLKRGWSFEGLDGRGLWIAVDYLYPACAAHWYAGLQSTLRVTHWRETAGRQSGMYSSVGLLPDEATRNAVRACCGDAVCLRDVEWGLDEQRPRPLPTDLEGTLGIEPPPSGDARVPCPEACSMFISLAQKVLKSERSPARDIPGLGSVREVEVGQLRSLVSAAAAGTIGTVREGEFDDDANTRRVRYLAAKLLMGEA